MVQTVGKHTVHRPNVELEHVYETISGDKVEILKLDCGGEKPVLGVILCRDGKWRPHQWTKDGRSSTTFEVTADDIKRVPREHTVNLHITAFEDFDGEIIAELHGNDIDAMEALNGYREEGKTPLVPVDKGLVRFKEHGV